MINVGMIPENFSFTDVYTFHVDELPSLLVARRASADELIWDADGGFSDQWVDRSSYEVGDGGGFDFHIARRSFSVAGLPIFASGVGGGGGDPTAVHYTDGGDLIEVEGTPRVRSINEVPIDSDGTEGQVLTLVGGEIVFADPGGGGGGDVVGPASAVTARLATFNGTTGKLIQDGGKTLANIAADISAAVAAAPSGAWTRVLDTNFTQLSAQTITDGATTIGGVVYTAANVASAATYMRVDSTGLAIQVSTANTLYFYANPASAPYIRVKVKDIAPNFVIGQSELRVWIQGGSNGNQNHEVLVFAIAKEPFNYPGKQSSWVWSAGAYDSLAPHQGVYVSAGTSSRLDVNLTARTPANSPSTSCWGIHFRDVSEVNFYYATTAAADSAPNDTAMTWQRLRRGAGTRLSNASSTGVQGLTDLETEHVIATVDDLAIVLAASPLNTSGHLLTTVKRLVVEVKY